MNKELNIKLKVIDKFWKAKLEEDAVQGLPEAFFIKEITGTPHQETSRIELPSHIVDGVSNLCGNDSTLSYIFFLTGLFITFKKYGAEIEFRFCMEGFRN